MVLVRKMQGRPQLLRRGVSAVELALVTPVLAMVMLGCIDFGRFPSTVIAVRNAARVGAEFGRIHPSTPATEAKWQALLRQAVVAEMSGLPGFDVELLSLDPPPGRIDLGAGRSQVRVTVTYPFQTIVPWDYPGLGVPNQFNVSHQVVMEAPGL